MPWDILPTLETWTWAGYAGKLKSFLERPVILSGGPNLSGAMSEIWPDSVELPWARPGTGLAYA